MVRKTAAELGAFIREYRHLAGMTQEELAGFTGINPKTISHYERGSRMPSASLFLVMADCVDADLSDLLTQDSAHV